MSAQLRIRTLITHMGRVYSAHADERTQIATTAIDDIVVKLNPLTPEQWVHAEHDVRRILNVWRESEGRTPAAMEFASNILSAFTEAAAATAAGAVAAALQHEVVTLPELEITEKPAPEVRLLTLSLPQPVFDEDADEDEDEDEEEEEVEVEEEEDEDEEEAEPEPAPVKKLPAPAPAPAPVAEVDSLADGDEEGADAEAEDNDEEAIVEPEAEADADAEEEVEEEGMEVEKRTIRGRDYWIDINTNKLYAVADDDEVGDEVGAVINGRPVFVTA